MMLRMNHSIFMCIVFSEVIEKVYSVERGESLGDVMENSIETVNALKSGYIILRGKVGW